MAASEIPGEAENPPPPVAEQEKIVAEIGAEQRLVEGNRALIERMEHKIAATLARIWGDDSPDAAKPVECGPCLKRGMTWQGMLARRRTVW